jgi:polysaccharide biosynthesis transport protein
MDLVFFWRVLLKRKWIIMAAALLAAAVAYLLTMNQPKQFKSSTQISTDFTQADAVRVNSSFSIYDAETKFNNAIVTFTSPVVISLLSYELMLHDLTSPKPFKQLTEEQKKDEWIRTINLEQAKKIFAEKLQSMTVLSSYKPEEKKLLGLLGVYGYDNNSLKNGLNVYRLDRTDYIQIDYSSQNPELSAFVVNDLFNQFTRYYQNLRKTNSVASIDTLRSLMEKKKQELDVKTALLQSMGGTVESGATSALDLAADLDIKLQEQRARLNDQQYNLRKVQQKINDALNRSGSGGGTATNNNEEIVRARRAANEAYEAYLSDPSNKEKKDRYQQLKGEYDRLYAESGTRTSSPITMKNMDIDYLKETKQDLEYEIRSIQTTIGSLESQVRQLRGEASSISSRGQTLETAKKERDLANQEYLEAKKKYSEAMDITGFSVNNYKQLVPAQPAIDPEPSKRKMIVGMAGAAAMITTVLIILLLTYLDSSIKTPYIFSKTVGLKLISMVNFMNLKNKNLSDVVAKKENPEDIHDRNKLNTFRESIRKLRYEVEKTGKQIFLFTSTKKGQGKTTLIMALSHSLSLSKKKILIIDTNFCNPDLTVALNAEPILEKMMPYKTQGRALVEQVKVFSKDVGEGLIYAIGSEGGDYTPSEVLPRENLLQHLKPLTAEFDYIFLEGPPLNDFSDSKELAEYVDGVIAIFSARQIIKQIDKQSLNFFKELNGKFCGAVLNMVDMENVNTA